MTPLHGTTPSRVVRLASPLETPLYLTTANGLIEVKTQVPMTVSGLDVNVHALLLDNSPEALCMGRLVEEHEYSFIWVHGRRPYFIKPDGSVVWLKTRYKCPYWD